MATLTRDQAEAVKERIGPTMGNVVRLQERMERVGFPTSTVPGRPRGRRREPKSK